MTGSISFGGNERFRLRRELGVGGMGVVYEALDSERNTLVALKAVRNAGPSAIARFKREFRSLAGVIHPNLVALYELIAEDEQVFFTMELVRGVHFDRWVLALPAEPATLESDVTHATVTQARTGGSTDPDAAPGASGGSPSPRGASGRPPPPRGELDVARLRAGLRQLAEGVAAIHDAGMLHRDLKPSNVLVTPEARVVILDFGLIAEIIEQEPRIEDRPLEGTYGFMSPEQGARAPLSPASDWYSVGVMLFRVLTGRMPFVGGRDDILMDKQRFEPPPPRELAPGVPEDLDALTVELLRRLPERRPTGVEVLRRLGSELVRGRGVRRTPATSLHAYDTIVGREPELAQLAAAYQRTREGASVLVRVAGPSGVGKSRMVRAFLESIAEHDKAVVLRGRCYEQESVPYKALDSLVDALGAYLARLPDLEVEGLMPRDAAALARLFPTLRRVESFTTSRRRAAVSPDPLEVRRRAFIALRELLARIADRGPLVLAIDDLQWGDIDSASLLAALLRPPDAPAVLLLTSFRSEGQGGNATLAALEQHVRAAGIDVFDLELTALRGDDALALALVHLGDLPAARKHAERLVEESQGNPFLIEELARHVRDQAGSGEPISLAEVMRGRLLRLPAAAGRLLSAIAVAGRPIAQALVERAAGVDDPSVLALLKAGSFARTRAVGEQRLVEAYHDRVRETALAVLDPDERRALHSRLALVYAAAANPDPETLAFHFAGAGESARAAEHAIAAARRATEALAFDRAASLCRLAMELDPAAVDRPLRLALADALANGGRGAEAADAYLAALEGATAAQAVELQALAASQLLYAGHIDRGLAALDAMVGAVGMKVAATPGRAIASIALTRIRLALRRMKFKSVDEREVPASQLVRVDVAFAATEGLGMADTIRAADFQARCLLLALKIGEPRRMVRALSAEVALVSLAGPSAGRRLTRLQAMLAGLVAEVGDAPSLALSTGANALAAFNLGHWAECLTLAIRAEEILVDRCAGMRWELATVQLFQGFALGLLGRIRELAARFPVLLEDANDRGDLYAATSLRACLGFYVPLSRDAPEVAHAEVDDAMARWSARGYHLQHANALSSRTTIDLYLGEGVRAFERCRAEWPALERSMLLRCQLLRVLMWGGRGRSAIAAYVQSRDRAHLRDANRCARKLAREDVIYAQGESLTIRAAVARAEGDLAGALALLEQAITASTAACLPLNTEAQRHARGLLLGGDEGAALVADALRFGRDQGLLRPEKLSAVFAPGFKDE